MNPNMAKTPWQEDQSRWPQHRCLEIFCLPIPKDDSGKIHETSEQKTVTSNENSETDSIFYM